MIEFAAGLTQLIGRFHPLLVHLPVGFIVLLAALELLALSPRFNHLASSSRAVLALTVPVALCSAVTGWLLAGSGDYDPQLLTWHRWMGVGVAAAVPLLLAVHWTGRRRLYRVCLWATLILVALTGHWGGSLTHGKNYLSVSTFAQAFHHTPDPPPSQTISPANLQSQPIYTAAIQPLFTKYCISCHGPDKAKHKLRLDSHDNLVKGSENGPVVEPGAAARSPLIQRLFLPDTDEDHMPPEGKRQPTQDELALLRWWVDAGAPTTQTLRELNPPQQILHLLGAPASQAKLQSTPSAAASAN